VNFYRFKKRKDSVIMLRVRACVVSIAPVLFFAASGVKTLSIFQRVVIDLICEKLYFFFFQFFSSILH